MEERVTSGSLLSKYSTTQPASTEVMTTDELYKGFFKCQMTTIFTWVTLILTVVGVTGNAMVLWLLGFHIRRNTVSVYILNLATADFIILCYYFVIRFMGETFSIDFSKPFLLSFCLTVELCSYLTGLSMLSAISLERCLSVLWPIWYRCHRSNDIPAITCAGLWTLALLFGALHGYNCVILRSTYVQTWCRSLGWYIVAYLVLLVLTLSMSSLMLLLRMCCGSHRIPLTRLGWTILLTLLVFFLCGLPLGIFWFLSDWIPLDAYIYQCYVPNLLIFLSCLNSSANPVIYFFIGSFRQRKRQTLRLVLQRALQDSPEGEEGGGSLPQETLQVSCSSTPANST